MYKHESIEDRYYMDKKIGEGSYGKVFECKTRDGGSVAVKMITMGRDGIESLLEVSIMMTYIHPNLNTCIRVTYVRPYLYLIQDKAISDMDLYIKKYGKIEGELLQNVIYQIIRGIDVLHSENIIHCDIKPGNILIYQDNLIKVTDFTLAVMTPPSKKFKHRVGTLYYTAPEVLMQEYWDSSIDIWSLGCTFYYIAMGESLIPDQRVRDSSKHQKVYECICQWKIKDFSKSTNFVPISLPSSYFKLPSDILEIIRSCIRFKPYHRTTTKKLLNMNNKGVNNYGVRYIDKIKIKDEVKIKELISEKVCKNDDDIAKLTMSIILQVGERQKIPIILLVETCVWISYKLITGSVPPIKNITFQSQLYMILKTELEICSILEYRLHK